MIKEFRTLKLLTASASGQKKVSACGLVLFALLLFLPRQLPAQEAQIKDILVTVQKGQLLVYAKVTNCFTKAMEQAIMAGVPTTFTFLLNLYQERTGWADKKVAVSEIRHTIKYDSVKKAFYVHSSLDRDPAIFQDLANAQRAMAEFSGTIVLPRSGLQKNAPHYVMMMAKLDKVRLPLYMEYVLFFVSLWDFETVWYRMPVTF